MTAASPDAAVDGAALDASTPNAESRSAMWQPGFWMANAWLLFLIFPAVSVLAAADTSPTRRAFALGMLAIFGAAHALGYRALIRREMGVASLPPGGGPARYADPRGSELWFGVMVITALAAAWAAGWTILAVVLFLVAYAVFHFTWRAAALVFAGCLVAVLFVPAMAGLLDDLWFFTAMLVAGSGAFVMMRVGEEQNHQNASLLTQLAVSEERSRVARDVHDVLGHSLTVIVLEAQVAGRMLASDDVDPARLAEAQSRLAEIESTGRRALTEIRSTVSGLRSSDLGAELHVVRQVLADAGVDLTVDGDPAAVPETHRRLLGWVVRESATNIVRHARASACVVEIGRPDAVLSITDDGVGRSDAPEGNGLSGLRERLAEAGLELRLESPASGGTAVVVTEAG